MKILEERILREGKVLPGNVLKVGSFINHMIDPTLTDKMGEAFFERFKNEGVTKILTVEASGIAIAYAAARYFGCPMVFAKKTQTSNVNSNVYSAPVKSFTHGKTYNVMVSTDYITHEDTVLCVDDFLAVGNALIGLFSIVEQAGAKLAGAGIAIEKGFQGGGDKLRDKGYRIESLAIIDSMEDCKIVFRH
ncbi:MAG: xanthine phosphoribosyltransferase [Clostridia bacterium]|nr:xanthine phosphoribosyltransferase [Clostridia bacterium]